MTYGLHVHSRSPKLVLIDRINDKNYSLSTVLTATQQKQQSHRRGHYSPSRRLYVNVMPSNITFLWFLQFLMRGC